MLFLGLQVKAFAEIGVTIMRKYSILVLFLCTYIAQAYQLNTTFDSLFPMTWYQKGLEASSCVLQNLIHSFENNVASQLSFDDLLGKLTRILLCVDQMKAEGITCLAEDKDYFVFIINKINSLIGVIIITPENEDFVVCAQKVVSHIQQHIQ